MMNIEKLAIEAGFDVSEGEITVGDYGNRWDVSEKLTKFAKALLSNEIVAVDNKISIVEAFREVFAKALQQSSEPVAEPLRINLGFGKYGIHHGTLDKVPCLTISNIGTGLVGEQTKHENMTPIKFENEVLSITFANKESFEVFRQEVNLVFPHPPASVPLEKYNKLLEALKEIKGINAQQQSEPVAELLDKLNIIYQDIYRHKDVAIVANSLHSLLAGTSYTHPPSTVPVEDVIALVWEHLDDPLLSGHGYANNLTEAIRELAKTGAEGKE